MSTDSGLPEDQVENAPAEPVTPDNPALPGVQAARHEPDDDEVPAKQIDRWKSDGGAWLPPAQ